MIYLINSATMRNEGTYVFERLDAADWITILRDAHESGTLESFIGYRQNADIIKQDTGISVRLTRSQLPDQQGGDTLLIMRLPYRLQNSRLKGKHLQAESLQDFELFQARYQETTHEFI